MQPRLSLLLFALAPMVLGQSPNDLALVVSHLVSRAADLPGEFLPFQSVSVNAKVPGFVERILVDRGSVVRAGDVLCLLYTSPSPRD